MERPFHDGFVYIAEFRYVTEMKGGLPLPTGTFKFVSS
jgi:hypothetical protein